MPWISVLFLIILKSDEQMIKAEKQMTRYQWLIDSLNDNSINKKIPEFLREGNDPGF